MKKSLLTLLALATSVCLSLAETSFDFSTSLPKGWSASVAPYGFEGGTDGRGAQFSGSSELTLPDVSAVTKVTIICSTNGDSGNSIAVQVGETTMGTKVLPKENGQTLTFSSETALDGDLKIIITRSKKSIWIKSVTIDGTYDAGNIEEEDPTEGLDANYEYSEPTKVVMTGDQVNKQSYTFICNNVKVVASMGTKTETYFGANAGTTLTFVTTREMKGIVVDGFVKKDFTAESSAGTIAYESPSEDDLEKENVLVVKDINTNVLTLTCDKQLRCYEVRIYFEENPDVTIDEGGDVDYSYYWEPEEAVTMNIEFDRVEYVDMTENLGYACTSLNFYCDTHEMEMVVFASTIEGTILPLGTYPVTNTYEANTVQASPGGDDYMDYATYIATDFETNDEGQELYNPYYVVSGELTVSAVEGGTEFKLQAATYNGSTVHATCIYVANGVEDASVATEATKVLRDGTILLRRNGKTFTILGERL